MTPRFPSLRNTTVALTTSLLFATYHEVLSATPPVTVQQTGEGIARRVVLENGYLRVVVNPSLGGRVESFMHQRTGKDLTMPLAETVPGGLLSDHVWQQNYWHADWNFSPYAVKILEQSSEVVKVELTSPPGKLWTGLSFQKVLTLWRDRSVLQADYNVSADDKVAPRCRPDLHFHQGLTGHGKVFLPTEAGVLVRPLSTEGESWAFDPSRGWLGYVNDNGTGLGATFDFQRIRAFRTSQAPGMTMEWILRKTEFKPGVAYKTPVSIAAFAGLKEISAIGERLALDMSVTPPSSGKTEARLSFAPFQNFKGKVSLFVRQLPDGKPTPAADRDLSFKTDTLADFNTSIKLSGEGNWAISGVVCAEGMADLSFEKPLFTAKGSGTYAMLPEANRLPETPDSPTWSRFHPIDLNFNSTAIPTPHRVWAKPYAGGRPRVLCLLPEGEERLAVELAQRFDLDITCAYLCDNTYYVLGDAVRSLKIETVKANLDKTVEQNFDVITLNTSDTWPLLTKKAKDRILEMVKNGAGLVLFQRGAPPDDLKEFMPLEFIGYDHATGKYTLVSSTPPMLAALPYEAMPTSYYSNGSRLRMKPDSTNTPMGTVLLKAVYENGTDRGPLIAIGEIGKGRLVEAQTEGHLVPGHTKFKSIHVPEAVEPNYDYWEYHYAMAARMIYWAARKESPVNLTSIKGRAEEVKIEFSSQITGTARLDFVLRDKFGDILNKKTQAIELRKSDEQTLSLPVSPTFQGACQTADVTIANEKGVLAFGAGTFWAHDVQIVKLAPEKPMYLPTDTATVIATTTNDLPQGAVVRAQLYDGAHREVAKVESPAAAETKLSLPLARVIGPIYEVRATLLAGDQVLDQNSCEGHIKAVRHPEQYKAFFWGGMSGNMTANITDAGYRLNESMGINANFLGEGPLSYDARFMQRLNIPYSGGALGMYTTGGVTKDESLTNKVEVGNAMFSPTRPAENRKLAAERGQRYKDQDIIMYSCGDENRGSTKDIDFSETGKRELRAWLQEKYYKTIDELNREWGTQYKSFDEVVAMSEAEAKEHFKTAKTCAPWLDQRLYTTWGAARLAKSITDGVRDADPDAIVGESGSQEPAVYGTDRDWWYMSRSYTGLAAYGGEQTVEQECYNPALIRYTWAGYGKPNPLNRAGFFRILGRYDKGIAIFASRSHIDPDFTLPECGRDIRGSLIELKRGIGQMLVSAKTSRDPVFILQSQSTIYGGYMLGLSPFVSNSRTTAMRLFDDMGVQYQYISYEQLATGHLKNVDCRVLVLPGTVAISPAEIAAIREWVKNGGTVVADMKTSLMTNHGRLYPKPELDDVFGIDRTQADATDTDADSPWTGNDANGKPVLQVKTVERGVTGTAQPLGQVTGPRGTVPIVFHNQYGKGHAYYFAADLMTAYATANEKTADPASVAKIQFIQTLYDKILGEASVQPQYTVLLRDTKTGKAEGRCPWVWSGIKKSGKTTYVILHRNYGVMETPFEDVPVTVRFAEPGVIYDVVAGKLMGRGDSVDLTVVNGTGRVFAILPSEVQGLDVKILKSGVASGEEASFPCEVKVAQGNPDLRILHVDVTQPDGEINRTYTTDLICPNGKGVVKIPFALNDKHGDWNVRVTDIASGVTTAFKVALR